MNDIFDLAIASKLGGSGGGSPSPAPQPTLITKNVTANGTYSASADNADGYSAVTVAVPQNQPIAKCANGASSAAALTLDATLDTSQPFEIVLCLKITASVTFCPIFSDNADSNIYTSCGSVTVQVSTLSQADPTKYVGFILFFNNHSYSEGDYIIATVQEPTLVCDGSTYNWLKFAFDGEKITAYSSADGVTYTLAEQSDPLPPDATNLKTNAGIKIGNWGAVQNAGTGLESFNIFNCSIKQNGVLIWGREIG